MIFQKILYLVRSAVTIFNRQSTMLERLQNILNDIEKSGEEVGDISMFLNKSGTKVVINYYKEQGRQTEPIDLENRTQLDQTLNNLAARARVEGSSVLSSEVPQHDRNHEPTDSGHVSPHLHNQCPLQGSDAYPDGGGGKMRCHNNSAISHEVVLNDSDRSDVTHKVSVLAFNNSNISRQGATKANTHPDVYRQDSLSSDKDSVVSRQGDMDPATDSDFCHQGTMNTHITSDVSPQGEKHMKHDVCDGRQKGALLLEKTDPKDFYQKPLCADNADDCDSEGENNNEGDDVEEDKEEDSLAAAYDGNDDGDDDDDDDDNDDDDVYVDAKYEGDDACRQASMHVNHANDSKHLKDDDTGEDCGNHGVDDDDGVDDEDDDASHERTMVVDHKTLVDHSREDDDGDDHDDDDDDDEEDASLYRAAVADHNIVVEHSRVDTDGNDNDDDVDDDDDDDDDDKEEVEEDEDDGGAAATNDDCGSSEQGLEQRDKHNVRTSTQVDLDALWARLRRMCEALDKQSQQKTNAVKSERSTDEESKETEKEDVANGHDECDDYRKMSKDRDLPIHDQEKHIKGESSTDENPLENKSEDKVYSGEKGTGQTKWLSRNTPFNTKTSSCEGNSDKTQGSISGRQDESTEEAKKTLQGLDKNCEEYRRRMLYGVMRESTREEYAYKIRDPTRNKEVYRVVQTKYRYPELSLADLSFNCVFDDVVVVNNYEKKKDGFWSGRYCKLYDNWWLYANTRDAVIIESTHPLYHRIIQKAIDSVEGDLQSCAEYHPLPSPPSTNDDGHCDNDDTNDNVDPCDNEDEDGSGGVDEEDEEEDAAFAEQ